MSYTSGFFDAIDQGGGDYDRVYSAKTFAHYFSLLVKNGVFPDPSTGLQVRASSNPDMKVSVNPGSGWINGYYITVPDNSPEVLTVPTANPSLSRIDSVIMGLNYVEREIQLYIKSGAVSSSPSAVSLQRDNDLYEMELAQITVAAGVASISQANITDTRTNTPRCGIVKGTIDQIDTTDLFAQYDDAFQTWFEDLKTQLSGDVVTNLQSQINQLKTGKADLATVRDLSTRVGTLEDTKTDLCIMKITSSRTITFSDALSDVFVLLFGGGAGGGGDQQYYGGPGGGHMAQTIFTPDKSKAYSILIGAGGAIRSAGGTSSFDTLLTAEGGQPGDSSGNGGSGGSGGGASGYSTTAKGGNASYGGGGGGVAGGGAGGTYGGGGGTETGSGGTKGTYGGAGGAAGVKGANGTATAQIPNPFSILASILPIVSDTTAVGGTGANSCGGGGGGYGSAGGKGRRSNTNYHSGGGGGGGFFADGGDGGDNLSNNNSGGGGGGGFFGKGGSATSRTGGAGGGGFLSEGGSSNYSGVPSSPVGYAAGGHSRNNEADATASFFYGGSGICIVAYIRKLPL